MSRKNDLASGNPSRTRGGVILNIALAALALSGVALEAQNATVTGVIQNASGQPVTGALVKVTSADSPLTFMVVSQAQGRYTTPRLLPGKYRVQGFGDGYQSDAAGPVEVSNGGQATMDVVLSAPQKTYPPEKRLTNADYARLMPDGDAKKIMVARCTLCHELDRPLNKRGTRAQWKLTVDRMGSTYLGERSDLGGGLSEEQRGLIVEYMAKNFGPETPDFPGPPDDPNRQLPRTLLKGVEAKYVAVEYDRKLSEEFHWIGIDSQGNAWLNEGPAGVLGRFDPKSLTYTRIAAPPGKSARSDLSSLAVDPQDRVWTIDRTSNNRLLQYDSKSGQFNSYDLLPPPSGRPSLFTFCFFEGNVWGTGSSSNVLIKLEPSTRKVTFYPVPRGSHPFGMGVGGDKMVWYVGSYDNEMVKFDPATGERTRYKVPTPGSQLRLMASDAEGNLWVGAEAAGKLVKVDYRTGKMTEYVPPTKTGGPYAVDVDTKRNLIWFSEGLADKIGRFDPRTNTFAEFSLPNAGSPPLMMQVDRSNPNRVWWSGLTGKVGYIEVME